jgi:bifunctional non-homologous end joining protein LigD
VTRARLTNLDRVLWPATGFTKGDLIAYYGAVAPALVPHLRGRALTLARFPDGVEGKGFAQMECRGHPDWMAVLALRLRTGATRTYCVVDDLDSLLWVANLNAIELHPYMTRAHRPDEPSGVTLDLDPGPGAGLPECCDVALDVRERVDRAGLQAVVKTSGASGLHVFVPVGEGHTFGQTRAVARELAAELVAARPDAVVDDVAPALRPKRVFVDWMQNMPRRSTVAPYSLRAMPRPSVSTPLTWAEVEKRPDALSFGPDAVLERLERLGDLYRPALELTQALP